MSERAQPIVAGVDVGTECVKVVVLASDRTVLGRAIVATRGYFQDRVHDALAGALDEAQLCQEDLAHVCVTGFGARCASMTTMAASETACHTRGAFHHVGTAMTLIDIGGRDPKAIRVDDSGGWVGSRAVRKCASGVGTFLMFACRHLDVHPTRMMELASAADQATEIGSYCSLFSEAEVIERIRDGATREEVALGCMHSIAERIVEMGSLEEPLVVAGGVAEYFPGVIAALESRLGTNVTVLPEPIMVGALGAALTALDSDQ